MQKHINSDSQIVDRGSDSKGLFRSNVTRWKKDHVSGEVCPHLETPTKELSKIQIQSYDNECNNENKYIENQINFNNKNKLPKLLSSKSLSKLVTKSLMMVVKRNGEPSSVSMSNDHNQNQSKVNNSKSCILSNKRLTKTKSFPTPKNSCIASSNDGAASRFLEEHQLPHPNELAELRRNNDELYKMTSLNRMNSDSMIVLSNGENPNVANLMPIQVSSNSLLLEANLSPIVGSQSSRQSDTINKSSQENGSRTSGRRISGRRTRRASSSNNNNNDSNNNYDHDQQAPLKDYRYARLMSWLGNTSSSGYGSGSSEATPMSSQQADQADKSSCSLDQNRSNQSNEVQAAPKGTTQQTNTTTTSKPFKPFKKTGLVLRDVKNSLTLRMKAKRDSQAFSRFTNELATPPTKLYSPFNIYNTPETKAQLRQQQQKLNQHSIESKKSLAKGAATNQMNCNSITTVCTPKERIARRHKRQLKNHFDVNSPTGRFREGIRDVEHFQQCIEDISEAIRVRDQSSTNNQSLETTRTARSQSSKELTLSFDTLLLE